MKKAEMISAFCAQLAYYGGVVNYTNCHASTDELRQHDALNSIDTLMWTSHCMGLSVEYRKTEIFNKEYFIGFTVKEGKNIAEMWCTSCNEGVDDTTYKKFKEWRGDSNV